MKNFPLKNWIPYKLKLTDGQLQCYWLNTFTEPFTEPFFDETIARLKNMPGNHASMSMVSDLSAFKKWSAPLPYIKPAAIIFHISRCGSTMVSQLLTTSNKNKVLPEVPFFDDILRLPYQQSDFTNKKASGLFDAALKFYGQTDSRQNVYIKTDSWHLFFYEQLRAIYPDVPFVLMYRNPAEVFNSHKKKAGMQAVPGLIEPALFGFKPDDEALSHPDLYLTAVLEKYLGRCLAIMETDRHLLFVDYNEGPMAIIKKILAFAGKFATHDELRLMEERSLYHSKKPGEIFSEPQLNKTPALLDKAMALYRQLNSKKHNAFINAL